MAKIDCFVSVIAPIYNDSEIIESYVNEVMKVLSNNYTNFELVLIDDGSTDDTVTMIAEMLSHQKCIRLIRLSRTFDLETAISAGIESAIGDYVVVMLPDLDPPELIPSMVDLARGGISTVFGIRKCRGDEPIFLRIGASLFYWYCNSVLKLHIPKNTTHFRVLSRQVVNALIRTKGRLRYLHTLSTHVGYSNQSFFYDIINRRKKPRTKKLSEAINLGINIIIANSFQPMRLIRWIGILISAFNAAYALYVVLVYLIKENVAEGWGTQSLHLSVMFFFIFVILTILCEYISVLLAENKEGPLYYILDEKNSSVTFASEERKNVVDKTVED